MIAADAGTPSVTIFGAGVAGLTAAHELVERGFRVLVVDPASSSSSDRGRIALPIGPRHLLATLRRIPLSLGASKTLADCVTPAPVMVVRDGLREPLWGLPGSLPTATDSYQRLRQLLDGSFSTLDVQMLFLRMLRYLTSCAGRREQDCAGIGLSDYLSGRSAQSGLPPFRFSASAQARMDAEARLIAGTDVTYCDARGALNALVQLHVGKFFDGTPGSCHLDDSSEDGWLGAWRQHLMSLGVRFARGELTALQVAPGNARLRVLVDWHGAPPSEDWFPSDYQVVATDAATAERVTRSLRASAGVAADLQGFASVVSGDPREPDRNRPVGRDPTLLEEVGAKPWDRLQVAPYVDFFLTQPMPGLSGVTYLIGSEWKLVCSVTATRSADDESAPASVLRVVAKNFRLGSIAAGELEPLTSEAIAREVWRQLAPCLPAAEGAREMPATYEIDPRFEGAGGVLTRFRGASFVAVAGDWSRRPEGDPSSVTGYPIHYDSLVFAGPYLRTFSRLGNEESASESARHAVNALLSHRANPSRCEAWSPEDCEPVQLAAAKELDARLFAQGLPHVSDLLALELLPRLASQRQSTEDPLSALLGLFEGFVTESAQPDRAPSTLLDTLRAFRQYLEQRTSAQGGGT